MASSSRSCAASSSSPRFSGETARRRSGDCRAAPRMAQCSKDCAEIEWTVPLVEPDTVCSAVRDRGLVCARMRRIDCMTCPRQRSMRQPTGQRSSERASMPDSKRTDHNGRWLTVHNRGGVLELTCSHVAYCASIPIVR
eukprot:2054587-Rhodomonas_salina.1